MNELCCKRETTTTSTVNIPTFWKSGHDTSKQPTHNTSTSPPRILRCVMTEATTTTPRSSSHHNIHGLLRHYTIIQFAVDRFLRWIVVALCSKAQTENELRASHSNKRNVNIRTYLWLWRRTVHCFNGNGKQKSVFTLWCDSCKHWKTCWMLINLCKLFHLISNTPKVIQDN